MTAHPFLKWVGGKRRLVPELRRLMPPKFGRYFEPFVGGGALFFAVRPSRATLGDANAELMNCYRMVRDEVGGVIAQLRQHPYDKEHYYQVRALVSNERYPIESAARTIYLNKAGFNGLYRVNSRGQFNVAFGRYTNPTICDEPNLRACSEALQDIEIWAGDFDELSSRALPGDFVYFDPPYVPVTDTADFTSYTSDGFGWEDQCRLAATFDALARRGVHVILSNSDVPAVRDLYRGYRIESVQAARSVNCNAGKRGKVGEVVVVHHAGEPLPKPIQRWVSGQLSLLGGE